MGSLNKQGIRKNHIVLSILIPLLAFAVLIAATIAISNQNYKPKDSASTVTETVTLSDLKEYLGSDAHILLATTPTPTQATEISQAPFKIVINYLNTLDCNTAELATYQTLDKLYNNEQYSPLIDQVVISYPTSLITSLIKSDSTEDNLWSGKTNFYTYLNSEHSKASNSEARETFVVRLANCK